jgi:hypothetical protein
VYKKVDGAPNPSDFVSGEARGELAARIQALISTIGCDGAQSKKLAEYSILKENPYDYKLKQNYPNPFNPSTDIKFNLPKSTNVRIDIYSITGQKIQTLINKPMAAGHHEVTFNAQNLSSGIYVYKIEAGTFQDVKKMILLR